MAIREAAVSKPFFAVFSCVIIIILMPFALCGPTLAQTLTVLHSFTGYQGDGYQPYAPVVADQNGVLYGTTAWGGNLQAPGCVVGCGEVFELTPPAQPGGAWGYSAIHEFTSRQIGAAGLMNSALTMDSKGRLYGVDGSLFRLNPAHQTGGFWGYRDLYDFTNGLIPSTPLPIDSAGALYGVSPYGGASGFGAVLQFVPTKTGPWIETILYQFTGGLDGGYPASLVRDDTTGILYGIASVGGTVTSNCASGCGTAFKLEPVSNGTWAYTVLYSFTGEPDDDPFAGLVRDSSGNLYALAVRRQTDNEVFKLTANKKGIWRDHLVHFFLSNDIPRDYCGYPPTFLTAGTDGNLYGAIFGDIDLYFGALFQLVAPVGGKGPWTYTTIWDFNESGPDLNPNGVVQGPDGALYGTTNGGDSSGGTVFQLQLPSQAPWPPSDFCY